MISNLVRSLGPRVHQAGLLPNRLAFALCRVGDSEIEIAEARHYIQRAGYTVLREPFQRKLPIAGPVTKVGRSTETRFLLR